MLAQHASSDEHASEPPEVVEAPLHADAARAVARGIAARERKELIAG
jgi:hypothetical protein